MNIQLSKHFMLSEFLRSETAERLLIDNTPSLGVVSNLQHLCIHGLEPLSEYFNTPIIISSGYRSPKLNAAVGGSSTSNHLFGYAADIQPPDNAIGIQWFNWMRTRLQYDELIIERAHPNSPTFWIHLAIRQDIPNRQRVIQNMIKH